MEFSFSNPDGQTVLKFLYQLSKYSLVLVSFLDGHLQAVLKN